MPGMYSIGGAAPASGSGLTGLDPATTSTLYSVTCWHQLGATLGGLFCQANNSGNRNGVYFYVNVGYILSLRSADAVANSTGASPGPRLSGFGNQWIHLAAAWDNAVAGRVAFYVNGAFQGSAALTRNPVATGGAYIGGSGNGAASLVGKLFDLRVFPATAINAAEVRATMDPQRIVGGCMGRWLVNWKPGASGTLYDESGQANHLTLSSTAARASQCEEPLWREAVGARKSRYVRGFTPSVGGRTGFGAYFRSHNFKIRHSPTRLS